MEEDNSTFDFVGQWINEEGNVLKITRFIRGLYRAKYYRRDGKLLFGNRLKLFIHMFPFGVLGKIEGDDLVVDLAGPLGPGLRLKPAYSEIDMSERLLPEIDPSISDGWEDVIGIDWLIPLSPFRRI